MFSKYQILYCLVICLLMQKVLSQESQDLPEDYIDEDLPESNGEEEQTVPAKAVNDTKDQNHKKVSFTEDRFTKLFQPRNRPGNNKSNPFLPKHSERVKPTLPSFIKRTPAIIRVTPSTPAPAAQNPRFNQRTTPTTSRTTTTRTPSRGTNGNNRRNQLNNNFNNRGVTSTTASPNLSNVSTDSSARRRFGGSNRRFNANATIPATTSRPRRN